jgi:hypothetical protein
MTPRPIARHLASAAAREQGMALITVLLLTAVVSAMTVTLAFSGRTTVLAGRNNELHARARAAAEAGLNHGLELSLANLRAFRTNGHADLSSAMSALLRGPDNVTGSADADADNGSLEALGIPRPPARVALGVLPGVAYEVRLFDDDDPARGANLTNADVVRILENGASFQDSNEQIVLRAVGYAPEGAEVVLEVIINPVHLPAIVVNGDLTIVGNSEVSGRMGSVHANGSLVAEGNVTVEQNMTSSGSYSAEGSVSVGGDFGGGRPLVSVPPVSAEDHRAEANYIMTSTGRITDRHGTTLCSTLDCTSTFGWEFMGAAGWQSSSNFLAAGTYFAEGDVKITGNPGSPTNPLALSVITTGSLEITGNPDLRPHLPELQFVTNGDLRIAGGIDNPPTVEGIILVREQLHISGNPTLRGQIVVQDVPSVSSLVTTNGIAGNPDVIYNGVIAGVTGVNVGAWREVR